MKVLITGAGGMVGSHLAERLAAEGCEVLGTYYRPTVDLSELGGHISLKECDVRYPQSVERILLDFQPERIFHLAAQSYPAVSWERPFETLDTNIGGTAAIFEGVKAVRRQLCSGYDPMVVVACSSAEYGESFLKAAGGMSPAGEVRLREDAPLLPLHPYGVSKVCQDLLAFQYFRNDRIRCIRARIFNSTGTRKVGDVTSDFVRRAVRARENGSPLIRTGNLDTRRAILDQRDLAEALILLAERGKAGEAYNICGERVCTAGDILQIIGRLLDFPLEAQTDPSLLRPSDEPLIAGDVSKLKADTGWSQRYSLEETVADMLKYWLEKEAQKGWRKRGESV